MCGSKIVFGVLGDINAATRENPGGSRNKGQDGNSIPKPYKITDVMRQYLWDLVQEHRCHNIRIVELFATNGNLTKQGQ